MLVSSEGLGPSRRELPGTGFWARGVCRFHQLDEMWRCRRDSNPRIPNRQFGVEPLDHGTMLERVAGIEPATSTLATSSSTAELHPQVC